MILIRKHENRKIVEASVAKWKRKFAYPPAVFVTQDPSTREWQAKARVH
jgi:hypothetical protein